METPILLHLLLLLLLLHLLTCNLTRDQDSKLMDRIIETSNQQIFAKAGTSIRGQIGKHLVEAGQRGLLCPYNVVQNAKRPQTKQTVLIQLACKIPEIGPRLER